MPTGDLNSATRLLGVIEDSIRKTTGSEAFTDSTYAEVYAITGPTEASVWLAGSRELAISDGGVPEPSEGYRIPAHLKVSPGDYVKVLLDSRGEKVITEVLPSGTYPKVAIDVTGGRIMVGDGTTEPVAGSADQALVMNDTGTGLKFRDSTDLLFIPFVVDTAAAGVTNGEMRFSDAAFPAGVNSRVHMPFEFDVVGITIRTSSNRTAGTLTVTPRINSNPTSISAQLNGSAVTTAYAIGAANLPENRGVPGHEIGAVYTTSADFATAASSYIYGGVFILVRKFRPALPMTTRTGSVPANAVLKKTIAPTFPANAILKDTTSAVFTLDAYLVAAATAITRTGTFNANAVFEGAPTYTANIYVSTGGNDTTGNGSIGSPYATLSKGWDMCPVGGRVLMRQGTYTNMGFKGAKDTITIENYPDEDVIIQRSTTGYTFSLENCRNVVIRGGIGGGSLTIRNTSTAHSGNSAGIRMHTENAQPGFKPSSGHVIDGVVIESIPGWGIEWRFCTGVTVRNVEIRDCATGVRFYHTSDSIIEDSVVHDMTRMIADTVTPTTDDNGGTGVALDDDSNNVLVRRNQIYNCSATSNDYGYDGGAVEIYQCHDCIIEYNVCWNNEGCIETGTANKVTYPSANNIIRRNIFYGRTNNNNATPMFLFRTRDIKFYHNVIDIENGVGQDVFRVQQGTGGYNGDIDGLKIKNNIIRTQVNTPIYQFYLASQPADVEVDYNLLYNTNGTNQVVAQRAGTNYTAAQLATWRTNTPYSDHDIWGQDPLFTNRLARDYRLQSASPGIDAGVYLAGVNDGFLGDSPDMGMFEYDVPYLIQDTFNRSVTGGWGNPDLGATYLTSGTIGDFNVNGTSGTHTHTGTNATKLSYVNAFRSDQNAYVQVAINKLPTGGPFTIGPVHRVVDPNNYYRFELKFNADGSMQCGWRLQLGSVLIGAGQTNLTGMTQTINTLYHIRTEVEGTNPTTLRAKVWKTGSSEPGTWTVEVTDSTANLQNALGLGLRSRAETGVSNLPIIGSFENYESFV